jgi:hypothetical protein
MTYKIVRNIIDVSHKYEVYIIIEGHNLRIDFYSETSRQSLNDLTFQRRLSALSAVKVFIIIVITR